MIPPFFKNGATGEPAEVKPMHKLKHKAGHKPPEGSHGTAEALF